MTSRIDQTDTVILMNDRTVVMSTHHKVNPTKTPEKVHPLIFKLGPVPFAGTDMGRNYDDVGFFLCSDTIDNFLGIRHQRPEFHSLPEKRRQPALDIGIGETDYCNVQSMSLQSHIFLEIRFAVICPDGICRKKRYIHGPVYPVIYRMSGLYIMIAYNDCIIIHFFHNPGKKMLGCGVNIIEIICGIVSLQTITGIDKNYIILAFCDTQTVCIPCNRQH